MRARTIMAMHSSMSFLSGQPVPPTGALRESGQSTVNPAPVAGPSAGQDHRASGRGRVPFGIGETQARSYIVSGRVNETTPNEWKKLTETPLDAEE